MLASDSSSSTIAAPKLTTAETEKQFSTLQMTREYENCQQMNRGLAALMKRLSKEAVNTAAQTSNTGGFHSDSKLFQRDEPEIIALRTMVGEAVEDFVNKFNEENGGGPLPDMRIRMWGWGVIMHEGDINRQHVHPDAKVSGVYYVRVPSGQAGGTRDQPGGSIIFADPRPRAHMNPTRNQISEIVITPKVGMMVLFPSYYEHSVTPFKGSGPRICIAFNADY